MPWFILLLLLALAFMGLLAVTLVAPSVIAQLLAVFSYAMLIIMTTRWSISRFTQDAPYYTIFVLGVDLLAIVLPLTCRAIVRSPARENWN